MKHIASYLHAPRVRTAAALTLRHVTPGLVPGGKSVVPYFNKQFLIAVGLLKR